MIVRKNISLNEEYLKKLEPLMQKHSGNLSAVIREVIDLADEAFKDPDSVKKLISGLKKEQNLTSLTLMWALKNLGGRLPEEETVCDIIGNNIHSISSLEKRLNELGEEVYWNTSVKINADDDRQPASASISITGKNQDMGRFFASMAAAFVARKYSLGILKTRVKDNVFEIDMKKGENEWALKSIADNFGFLDAIFSELYKKMDFWNVIVNLYAKMNYDMVTASKQFIDEVLGEKPSPKFTVCFERFFGCSIDQIPLDDLIKKMKMLFEPMGIIEKMEIYKDSLVIHHGLTDATAIRKLANIFIDLIKLNGHAYSCALGDNLIILKRYERVNNICIKILDDLKSQNISVEDFREYLPKVLDVLGSVPFDDKFLKSIGSEFGRMIIQKYEKNNRIYSWDADTFINYLQEANAFLKQDTKWEVIGGKVIHGKILSCPLAKNNGNIKSHNCAFMKGMFEGWSAHAAGEQCERIYRQTMDKDKFCEIYVAF